MSGRTATRGGQGLRGLRRFVTAVPPAAEERCEMCGVDLATAGHRHLVDIRQRSLACACTPCALLFEQPGAAGGRFRVVPDRVLRGGPPAEGVWERLRIPVGVAFLFRNSDQDRTVALYPSPAGATESDLDPATWESALVGTGLATAVQPDVEALLLRRAGERTDCYLVPVDAAYELVGRMRLHWRGFDGGSRAHAELDAYFAGIERRARDLRPGGRS
ncbi:DUF5947 family protein [Streptomyces sp. NPDC059740]|uniref:DUF5947 family protein n=1 Tax=Streptomyces sp. NPDC059740 TaxID=3346926 RepID=UPI00365949DC